MIGFPVVDAHQHFWDLDANYYPWLCDAPPIPFRYGDYAAIRRSYLPGDYRRDTAGFDVSATVHVEAEWNPADPTGETRWLEGLAAREGLPSAAIAQAWLDRDDVPEVLAAQAASPLVRGVRHKPRAAPDPASVVPGAPGTMGDPRWRAGYALLETHALTFDLQTPWWHLAEAAELARDFPGTTIILNHTGLPADRSEDGLLAWRRAMTRLAAEPNVAVKISGLGQPGVPWMLESNRRIVLDTIGIFGVERCMFASNFPVDSLVGRFAVIFDGFAEAVAELSTDERRRLFHDNAVGYYRLDAVVTD